MRARGVWIAAVVLLAGSARAEAGDPRFGVVSGEDVADVPGRLEALAALGIGSVRVSLRWDQMEAAPGTIDWTAADRLVDAVAAKHLGIYWDFGYAPRWANGNRRNNHPPRRPDDFRRFVYAVVRRYGFERRQIRDWGNWNEADLSQFYEGGLKRFRTHELPAITEAVRAADPDARLVIGELSSKAGPERTARAIGELLRAAGPKVAAISQHLYHGGDSCAGRLAYLDALHAALARTPHSALPIWVTETGLARPEEEKAAYLACILDGMKSRPWWSKTFWYRYEDEGPDGSPYSFGLLLRVPGSRRQAPGPTYSAYKRDILAASRDAEPRPDAR